MPTPTMKSCRIQFLTLLLAGLIAQPTHAEVIPGRWEKVSDLDLGTPITVELKNGDRVEGDFEGLSASDVDLETHSGSDSENRRPDYCNSEERWRGKRSPEWRDHRSRSGSRDWGCRHDGYQCQ